MKDFERKIRIDLVFWCTDERYIDDLQKMLEHVNFNSENATHGGYGYSFVVPEQDKMLKKLRK
jgi:hypothetical protein